MPVTTRSMRRRHQLQLSYPESNIVHSSVSNLASDDFSDSVPDLNDQHLSSSSSSDESSTLLLDDEDFKIEISNFQISCGESTPEVVSSPHNLEIPSIVNMESDCADEKPVIHHDPSLSTQDMIVKTLEAISSQMLCNYQHLQDQLTKTANDIQRLTQENETFRSEIRRELENVLPCSSLPAATTVVPVPSVPTLTSNPDMQSSVVSSTSPPGDFQTQMLLMLNETFSKLSTALTDNKSADTKSEWPKFSGDPKKFRTWYLAIMTQLSVAPWSSLYDPVSNMAVSSTTDASLNSKLYAKLISSLEGQALQNMVARKHVRTNGLLLLRELQHMYKPRNVPEMIAAKTGEFGLILKGCPMKLLMHIIIDFRSSLRISVRLKKLSPIAVPFVILSLLLGQTSNQFKIVIVWGIYQLSGKQKIGQ